MIPRTIFSTEHEIFRRTVQRFIAEHVTPYHADWEKAGEVPRDLWLKAGELGLLCCNVPEEYGGMGGGFLFSAILVEEFSLSCATGPTFYLHSDIVAPYLVDFGTEEQKQKWLPSKAKGEVTGALGMTEPARGSNVAAKRTVAVRDGDDYVINGQKVFITNGHTADLLLLACKTDPTAGGRGVSLIMVETDAPGYDRGRKLDKLGFRAQDTSELFFTDMHVPVSNLLGGEGSGFSQLMTQLSQEWLIQAIRAVASAEAALRWTVDYVSQREMFGHTWVGFQNTRFELGGLHAEVLAQRVFIDRCTELHMEGALDATDAAAAKLVTTELQGKVMDRCLQLFGAWGYMWEYPITRAFADARMSRIGGGTVEVMKQIIANALLPKQARMERRDT